MQSFIHEQIKDLVAFYHIIPQNERILLAISGGQDSLCLIKILKDLKILCFSSFRIVHFDHQWRNDSEENSYLVVYLSYIWEISMASYKLPINITNETISRKWRYQILYFLAQKYNYSILITAHTYTDKIETCLLNLFRGCSLEGISPLSYLTQLTNFTYLNRPLLFSHREHIAWFCKKFFLPVWSDYTNYNYHLKRNRLRYELLPYIRQYFNVQFDKQLNYTIHFTYRDSEYLQYIALYFYYKIRHEKFAALNKKILLLLHCSIQYRIFKIFLKQNFSILSNRSQIHELYLLIKLTKLNYITTTINLDFNTVIFYNCCQWIYCCWYNMKN
uniref:tRNA(Ile)-lysidine synthase n=1 Tax=Glaucosphaera vacuolata TaxID=38265 RepID=UPI001FCD838F|nr:tRNA(Ile)-lysidine synthase [Glaucosphaera vacuolata]UNJ18642.1 tRNA(Ile)-lysidine synthase [Glaucosphaera vacuolata]